MGFPLSGSICCLADPRLPVPFFVRDALSSLWSAVEGIGDGRLNEVENRDERRPWPEVDATGDARPPLLEVDATGEAPS